MSLRIDVGIVIPAYNCERFLAATLDSVLAQVGVSWQCVVIDDGSTDGSLAIAQRYAAIDPRILVEGHVNAGPCVARNLGYRLLDPGVRFVTFMDADDLWLPGALRTLVNELEAFPEAIGVHGLGEIIDETGAETMPGFFPALGRGRIGCTRGHPTPWPLDKPTTFETVVTASVIFPPGLILTRRDAYEQAGLFDPEMRYAEDWDILIRLSRLGHFRFLNQVILLYRRHANNVGQSEQVARQCARVQHKAFFSRYNSPAQRRIVRYSWRASQIIAMRDRASAARSYLIKRQYIRSLMMVGRMPFILFRLLRGYPVCPPTTS